MLLGVVLVMVLLACRSGDLPAVEIRIGHERRNNVPHDAEGIQRRWKGGLVSPQPPRLDGQGVEGEKHHQRRAVEIGFSEPTEEQDSTTEVWSLLGGNTSIATCPHAPHLSTPAADHDSASIDPASADQVWAKLEQAVAERHNCPTEQCCQVRSELLCL